MNVSSSIEGYGLNLIQGGMKELIVVNRKQDFIWHDTLKSGMRFMRDDLTYPFMPLQEEKRISSLACYGLHLIYPTMETKEYVQLDKKVRTNQVEQESHDFTQSSYFTSYGLHLIYKSSINPNKEHILTKLEPTTQKEDHSHFIYQEKVKSGRTSNDSITSEIKQIKLGKGSYTNTLDESMTSNLDGYGLMLI